MARRTKHLSDQIRNAINDSGLSRYAICKACDIDKGTMSRFMSGQVGLSLETIDRVGVFLDLQVVKRQKKKGRK